MDPTSATGEAPRSYRVRFTTTKGAFSVAVTRSWSPLGADRLYHLVKAGFYTNVPFFRNIEGFMVQFGLHGDPIVTSVWQDAKIRDDPVGRESNSAGRLTFATSGPDSRSCQMFINYGDNSRLDAMGFTPVGVVEAEGMDVVIRKLHVTGEGAPGGPGPAQGDLAEKGAAWLKEAFPLVDYITEALIESDTDASRGAHQGKTEVIAPRDGESVLLSRDKPAEASTRGNLGAAGVVTRLAEEDWLTDRWAAQANMQGGAMPLPQWLTVDLGDEHVVTRVEIDWETAFARQYEIKISKVASSGFVTLFEEQDGNGDQTSDKHILHKVAIPQSKLGMQHAGRYVKLILLQSGTDFGISVWHFDIYGYPREAAR